ncbi:MAG: imidazole glycerol phosphate synthase subunit HisH [bacterium]|nr:imidazole glycerol phosphate synthase subunit HisH [bacterium]
MIAIIDYKSGNIASLSAALDRLGQQYIITADPDSIRQADKVILPGVGRAKPAMKELQELDLVWVIRELKQPLLGICLGMQLLMQSSAEDEIECLGIIKGSTKKFTSLKVPQIGWNVVAEINDDPLFSDIPNKSYFYFVHSYYVPVISKTIGSTLYGKHFSAVIKQDNYFGVQFHPEKSGSVGQQLLNNFLNL